MKHTLKESGITWTGFQSDFQINFISETRIFAVYTWDTPIKSLALISFDPMQPELSPMPTSMRIIGYESVPATLALNPVNLLSFSTSLSDDKKYMYIGGGMKGMSSLFKWSISARAVSWHFLIIDIIDPLYK